MKIKMSIQNKLRIAFVLIIAVVVGVSALSFVNISKMVQANNKDKQSSKVLIMVNDVAQTRKSLEMTIMNTSSASDTDVSTEIKDIEEEYYQNMKQLLEMTKEDSKQQALLKQADTLLTTTFSSVDEKLNELKDADNAAKISALSQLLRPGRPDDTAQGTAATGTQTTGSAAPANTQGTTGNTAPANTQGTTGSTASTGTQNTTAGNGEQAVNEMQQLDTILSQVSSLEQTHMQQRESQTNMNRTFTFSALIGGTVIAVLLSLIIMFLIDRTVVKNIRKASAMLRDIAEGEGDLTKRLEIKSSDEIGELAIWFNSFIEKIGQLIGAIISNADLLSNSTQEVLSSIEHSNKEMLEVVDTIVLVSDNIQSSAGVSQEAMASIDEVATQAQMIQNEAQSADHGGEKVVAAASEGEAAVREAVLAIDTVRTSSADVLNVISELKKASNEIGKIVAMMGGITEQTSMLSLNASIEAARAGDAGRGFAVVAGEVKKLSEESKKSAEQIAAIIEEIQDKVDETDRIINQEQQDIGTSADKVLKASERFTTILGYVNDISQKIKSMTEASKQQSTITKEMTGAINVLAQGIQQNASASQQISASMDTQVSIYKEIEQNMENISEISSSMKAQTDRFKL